MNHKLFKYKINSHKQKLINLKLHLKNNNNNLPNIHLQLFLNRTLFNPDCSKTNLFRLLEYKNMLESI